MTEDQLHRLEYTLYILEEMLMVELEDIKMIDGELKTDSLYESYKLGEMNAMLDTLRNLTGDEKWSKSLSAIKKSILKGDDTYAT